MPKNKYEIGDAVTVNGEAETLYVVIAVNEFNVTGGLQKITTYEYEVIRIYPYTPASYFSIFAEESMGEYATYQSRMWKTMVEFLQKDLAKNGIHEKPRFLQMVRDNREEAGLVEDAKLMKATPVKIVAPNGQDQVKYGVFKTVDECLDRLNDMDMLLDMFKDDPADEETRKEYIKAKEVITKKMKRLLKSQE